MDFVYQIISEELIQAIGWTVIHSFWQATLIGIILAVVMIPLQNRSARLRYELAGFSLLLVLLSAIATFTILYDQALSVSPESIVLSELDSHSFVMQATHASQDFLSRSISYFDAHMPLIVSLWLLGATFFLLRLLGGYAYVQHIRHHRNQALPEVWQRKLKRLSRSLAVKKSIALLESSLVKVPMVIGSLKPAILLPIGAVNNLSEQEVEAILAHELAHIWRNDYLLNLFLSAIEVVFYYHPAVWWISGSIRAERENCCDDVAVKLCGNSLTYAKALVQLQTYQHAVPVFAMSFSGRKTHLLKRIKRILNQPQKNNHIMEKITATAFLLLAVLFLSVSAGPSYKTTIPETTIDKSEQRLEEQKVHVVFVAKTTADTIPPAGKNRRKMILHKDDQRVELMTENGEVTQLKVDGEEIPQEDYEEYSDLIEELREEVVAPPHPPNAPPAPQALRFDDAPRPPMPPAAPRVRHKMKRQQTITTEQNEDGNITIIIESDEGEEPIEIVVDDASELIFIDGNMLEDGDTAIIINEVRGPKFWHSFAFPNKGAFQLERDTNVFFFDQDHAFAFEFDEKQANVWMEKHNTELEKLHDQLEKARAGIGNYNFDELAEKLELREADRMRYLEDQNRALERAMELKERTMDRLRERQEEQLERQLERHHEHLERLNRKMEKIHDKDWRHYEMQWKRAESNVNQKLEAELLNDGLISDPTDYRLDLSDRKFKVNGKKQPDHIHEKYLMLYRKAAGFDDDSQFNISINKSN